MNRPHRHPAELRGGGERRRGGERGGWGGENVNLKGLCQVVTA